MKKLLSTVGLCAAMFLTSSQVAADVIDTGNMNTGLVVDRSSATHDFSTAGLFEYIETAYLWVDISTCSGSFDAAGVCTESGSIGYANEIGLSLTNLSLGLTAELIAPGTFDFQGNPNTTRMFWLSDIYSTLLPDDFADIINNTVGYAAPEMAQFGGISTTASDWRITFTDTVGADPKRLNQARFFAYTVPAPGALALLSLGLLVMGFSTRSRKA